ncbi:PAS domain S-box protein [Neorhodopirellula pilleata]|uniref:Transcriptional regulatory protein FixJ n=1 Tax=Neorhodopirellula pilleata TaxID=2714738 RepID=A0A5C6ABG2_9BACT|nr:PAS domain S-box protein [Neorhodopirellula pilleata]TWT95673.1 Transcriptional regulatory protein FixJ [Neorhodopirellula pilleata]
MNPTSNPLSIRVDPRGDPFISIGEYCSRFGLGGVAFDRADYRILYANTSFQQMVGRLSNEVIGRSFGLLLAEDCRQRFFADVCQLSAKYDVGLQYDYQLASSESGCHWIRLSFTRDSSTVESVGTLSTLVMDISNEKRLASELQASNKSLHVREQQLRQMVESTAEGVVFISPAGRYLQLNESAARMLGYSATDLVGKSIFDLMDAEAARITANQLGEHRREMAFVHEAKLKHRLGYEVWLLSSSSPIFDSVGTFLGLRCLTIDITHRKRSEELIKNATAANAKLELLSDREREVFDWVVSGAMNKEIAKRLDISDKTVERHRSNLMKKLGVRSLAELVRISLTAEMLVR